MFMRLQTHKVNAGHRLMCRGALAVQELGSCPTVLQAAQDSLTASYALAPALKLTNFASVSVFACYSAASGYDRAWRKPNKNNLAVRRPVCPPSRAFTDAAEETLSSDACDTSWTGYAHQLKPCTGYILRPSPLSRRRPALVWWWPSGAAEHIQGQGTEGRRLWVPAEEPGLPVRRQEGPEGDDRHGHLEHPRLGARLDPVHPRIRAVPKGPRDHRPLRLRQQPRLLPGAPGTTLGPPRHSASVRLRGRGPFTV